LGDFFRRGLDFGIGDGLLQPSSTASLNLDRCGVTHGSTAAHPDMLDSS
jgi:hypothetical protein